MAAPKAAIKGDAAKSLAGLNELTQVICPKSDVSDAERAALVDVAEAVGARDNAYLPTAQGVLLASMLEKSIDSLKGQKAPRVLVELALSLARLGGPDSLRLEQPFFNSFLGSLGIKKEDAKPRPNLSRELADIGEWAAGAVEKWAPKLPAPEASRARVRLLLARGKWPQAESLARKELAAQKNDARWQGWLAAALICAGRAADAEPYAAAADATGGEAKNILSDARALRARVASIALTQKTFKVATAGPALDEACKKFFTDLDATKAKSKNAGELSVACANVLWQEVYADWLQRAVAHLPPGSSGGALRAADLLRRMFGQGMPARPSDDERKALLERFLVELKPLPLDPADRRVIKLLGYLAAASKPIDWRPTGAEEKQLIDELDTQAPCDASGFALRSVARRADRKQLGVFLAETARTCVSKPGGAGAAVDATELLLQLVHEKPPSAPVPAADVEALAADIARAHPNDPQALTLHADAVALHELGSGKPRAIGLEAALSRYEEAIAISTPASGPAARSERESNAALISILLAELQAKPEGKHDLLQRAANHLRVALAFGEEPPLVAVRALFDLENNSGGAATAQDLARLPQTRARARAACMLAREASSRSDGDAARAFLKLATEAGPADEHQFDVDELVPDTSGSFRVTLDEKTLRPLIELKTSLNLAPACDPLTIKPPPPAAKPRSK